MQIVINRLATTLYWIQHFFYRMFVLVL